MGIVMWAEGQADLQGATIKSTPTTALAGPLDAGSAEQRQRTAKHTSTTPINNLSSTTSANSTTNSKSSINQTPNSSDGKIRKIIEK